MRTFAFILLHVFFPTNCAQSSGFFITNERYTWHEAVRNPPCDIFGMTNESIYAFSLVNANTQDFLAHGKKYWIYGYTAWKKFERPELWSFTCYKLPTFVFDMTKKHFGSNVNQQCLIFCDYKLFLVVHNDCICYSKNPKLPSITDLNKSNTCKKKPCSSNTACDFVQESESQCACLYTPYEVHLGVRPPDGVNPRSCLSVFLRKNQTYMDFDIGCKTNYPVLCYENIVPTTSTLQQTAESTPTVTRTILLSSTVASQKTGTLQTTTTATTASTLSTSTRNTISNVTGEEYGPNTTRIVFTTELNTSTSNTDNNIVLFLTSIIGIVISVALFIIILFIFAGVCFWKRYRSKKIITSSVDISRNVVESQQTEAEYDEIAMKTFSVTSPGIKTDESTVNINLLSEEGTYNILHESQNHRSAPDVDTSYGFTSGRGRKTPELDKPDESERNNHDTSMDTSVDVMNDSKRDINDESDKMYNELELSADTCKSTEDVHNEQYNHVTLPFENPYNVLDIKGSPVDNNSTVDFTYDTMANLQQDC